MKRRESRRERQRCEHLGFSRKNEESLVGEYGRRRKIHKLCAGRQARFGCEKGKVARGISPPLLEKDFSLFRTS